MQGRRHVALFPLPAKSHIYPFLGLCPELVRRGYHVTLVTDEPNAQLAGPAGAEPVVVEPYKPATTALPTETMPLNDPRFCEAVANVGFNYVLHTAAMTVWQLDRFYKENRPDLVVYEYSNYAGRILAKRLQSPVIQYYPDFIRHRGHVVWEGGEGCNPRSISEFSRLLDSFLWAYGFEETNNFWHSEDLNLYQLPGAFQFDADSIDSRRFCFVGPFLDRPFRPVWKNQSGGKRTILVSGIRGLLTDANYFNVFIDALSGTDYHVILSVGESFPTSELQRLPENFEINRFASHLEILPHADLHFYSGGPTGTLEGFYFGVPLIAVPSHIINYRIANRLAELGFARALPFHAVTEKMIRECVETALQGDASLGRVKQMQAVVRSSGGSVMAVDRIEEFLAGRA